MHHQSLAAILCNDLDSMVHRIEELPAHVEYTNALNAVHAAKAALIKGRGDLHQADMKRRYSAAS